MGILSLMMVAALTLGMYKFYQHYLDSSNNHESSSLIQSKIIEVDTNPQNSMGRSYERLKAEYIKRKQTKVHSKRDQSPPITPSTDVTRFGTQTEAHVQDDMKSNDGSSNGEDRAAEFVFPTRHFVAQADVELHSVDLR